MIKVFHFLVAFPLVLAASPSFANGAPLAHAGCAAVSTASERPECFDKIAAGAIGVARDASDPRARETLAEPSPLSRHWELEQSEKRGLFSLRPHQKNYLLIANHSSSPNSEPFSQYKALAPAGERTELMSTEIKYQLSLKTKVVEDLSPFHVDLWAAYSQQSLWQAYNRGASSPFRDTNYQPELMAVMPLDIRLPGGIGARFINFGIVHQSNGQSLGLSRSWDRIYAQIGLEKGDFNVLARVWQRRSEPLDDDDNPDILDYMGHGDLIASYERNGHNISVALRRNFSTKRGAIQADWAFPLAPHLKGYLQAFSGYGLSLIDYNHSQSTIGMGVLMDY